MTDDAQRKIDDYLAKLRRSLRGLKEEDVHEVIAELRSHIVDKAREQNLDAVLADLGAPEELAAQYAAESLFTRAEVSRTPWSILKSLFRWASLSVAGFFVLMGSLLGYFSGVVLILCGYLKLVHPQTAGVWTARDANGDLQISVRLGFGSPPPGAHEILGWWIVPLGILVGFSLVMLTTRFALWCARRYRSSRALPRA
ncbi:MAG TPA: DUF1700 domain-containing protein [Terriglobales bacterium]|nr:DUF1700 domain-containing protein [Terriglobales bacterium]